MTANGTCRVCGGPSVGTMPCYRCMNLLLERDFEAMSANVRAAAATELEAIVAKANENGTVNV